MPAGAAAAGREEGVFDGTGKGQGGGGGSGGGGGMSREMAQLLQNFESGAQLQVSMAAVEPSPTPHPILASRTHRLMCVTCRYLFLTHTLAVSPTRFVPHQHLRKTLAQSKQSLMQSQSFIDHASKEWFN